MSPGSPQVLDKLLTDMIEKFLIKRMVEINKTLLFNKEKMVKFWEIIIKNRERKIKKNNKLYLSSFLCQ